MLEFEDYACAALATLGDLRHAGKKSEFQARIRNKSIPSRQSSTPTDAFGTRRHSHYSWLTFV